MNRNELRLDKKPDDCELFEPMISASLDNELSSKELCQLNEHMANCDSCRSLAADFAAGNAAVELLGSAPLTSTELQPIRTPGPVASTNHSESSWFSIRRVVPIGVAATLLICFGIAMWPNPKPVNANQISAEEIAKPIFELETLNSQKQQDQNLMLRTLGMDLRAMKLEISQLEPGSEERERLETQIDSMIEKVRKFETDID